MEIMDEDKWAREALAREILTDREEPLTKENIEDMMYEIAEQERFQKEND